MVHILVKDIFWVVVCLLAICLAENEHFDAKDPDYTIFKIIFEVVSAYGPIGLSLGSSKYSTSMKIHISCFQFERVSFFFP